MKRLSIAAWLFVGAFLAAPLATQAQDLFIVLSVNGTIQRANGSALKRGDRVNGSEQLTFKGASAAAALVHPRKGRYVVKSGARGSSSEFKAILGQHVVASRPAQRLSSRDAGLNNQADIAHYIAGTRDGTVENRLLFGVWRFEVSPASFPLNDSRFFFVRYDYRGEAINKKLDFQNGSVAIDPATFYTVDGKPIDRREVHNCALFYLRGDQPMTIGAFQPVFASKEQQEEVRLLVESYQSAGVSAEDIFYEVTTYLSDHHGKPVAGNLKTYLNDALGLQVP